MKIRCNQQILSRALNTVSRAVSTRTTMPVLKGILLVADADGTLTLTSSDLEISIRKKIEVSVEEPGAAVVVSKLFMDIIRKLPNEDILIEKSADGNIVIKTNSSQFTVVTLPVDEFPNVEDAESEHEKINLNANLFKDMVKKTSFAASTDESKGVLVGVLTEISNDGICMVALDGYRLAICSEKMPGKAEKKFIISAKILGEISKIIAEEGEYAPEEIELLLGKKKASLKVGHAEVMLRLMEGEFINYRSIMPSQSTTDVIIGREVLQESIERASLLANEGKNNLIKMSIKNNLMTITSRSEEGNVREEIIMEKEGEDLDIGFNSKYVSDVLKAIEDEEIKMKFLTGTSPCTVTPVNGDEYEYLVLPVRIPNM